MNLRPLLIVTALTAVLATQAQAALTITAGDWSLPPDQESQITITVSGGTSVQGLNLAMQIGDGGSSVEGADAAPLITAIDVVGPGLVFYGNNNGQDTSSAPLPDLIAYVTTSAQTGGVSAEGILARVTIDTSGAEVGRTYSLLLSIPFYEASSDFASDSPELIPTLSSGSITVIPEPASLLLAGLGGLLIAAGRRRG